MSSVRIEGRGERDKGEEPEDMDEQEDDQVRRIAVDDYLTECGGFGSYQWRLFALTGPVFSFFFNWKLDLETLSLSLSLSLSLLRFYWCHDVYFYYNCCYYYHYYYHYYYCCYCYCCCYCCYYYYYYYYYLLR